MKTIPQPNQSRWTKWPEVAFFTAYLAYLGLCAYSSIELDREVPVSYEDLRSASLAQLYEPALFRVRLPQVFAAFFIGIGTVLAVTGRGLITGLAMIPPGFACSFIPTTQLYFVRL